MQELTHTMPWLADAAETLAQALDQNRMAHAVLLTGDRGVGKRRLANAFAALLACERRTPGSRQPCGQCRQCQLVEGESHPDIRVYQPEKSKMIKIDQIRALSAFAVASPQVGALKVIILDRADQLNINAANALLKTLEEPVADVVLLSLQETGRPVLPTIRSRCRVLPIATPNEAAALAWLAQQTVTATADSVAPGPDHSEAAVALRLAGGAPGLALTYLNSGFLEQRKTAIEAFRQFMKGAVTVAEATRSFRSLGHEAVLWLMENWAADLARVTSGGAARDHDLAEVVGYLAKNNAPWRAHEIAEEIRESRLAMVNNASLDLEISRLLMCWQALMPRRQARADTGHQRLL
ncbi:DNA polymerase III subunit delta' [uncultured Marinobacter sp.]|uniref:DNA polymerase III subunit delta' n=1 Tax=uncultured Marinobacter sp. TaxID=187379 RepID=UPI0030DC4450